MSEIINIQNVDGQLLVSSREVATNFDKDHGKVLRAIEEHIEKLIKIDNPKVACQMFIESEYENRGKFYKEYLMNRDGFSLLVMSFNNTKDVLNWKLKYIEIFNKMEQKLKNPYANMSPELKAIFTLDSKQQEQERRITDIEEKMTVNYELALNIQNEIKSRAVEILGGKDAEAYKRLSKKLFSSFHKDIKRTFRVNSYKNLSVKHYDEAMKFIESWEPKDEVLNYAIKGLNSQLAFV